MKLLNQKSRLAQLRRCGLASLRRDGATCESAIQLFNDSTSACAFTLIELIIILALLAIATSIAAPSLSRFFRGQTLNSEARQLLSLTHAGQARAISDGFPMLLWVDTQQRAYGLQEETTSSDRGNGQNVDPKAEEFVVDDRLRLEVIDATPISVNGRNLPAIRFLPDGTVDETSLTKLRLTQQDGETLWLIQATNRLSYEIRYSDR